MGLVFQVLLTILVAYVKGEVYSDPTEAPSYGCSSLDSAKTINDEIEKLFKAVSLREVAMPYFLTYVQVKYSHPFDACYPRDRSRGKYFSDSFYFYLGTVSSYSINNEIKLRAAEALKRNLTDIAEIFKSSWMKVRKIYKLNQGIFEGLDVFFQDSLMQKAATIGTEAQKDKRANSNKVNEIVNQLSSEFANANELMKMMPRQILDNSLRFQQNIIYSQVHSALANTKHKDELWKDVAIADRIKVFSEMSIKENIKKATKNLFTTYIKGYDDATRFSSITQDIEKRLAIVANKADEVKAVKSCQEGKKTAEKLLAEGEELRHIVGDVLYDIVVSFDRDLRAWFDNTINSYKFLDQIRQALNFVSPIVPQNVHPELDELYTYVTNRANKEEMPELTWVDKYRESIYVLKDGSLKPYEQLTVMLSKVIKVSDCYRKVFQFFGQTVQGCSDGVSSLREIYDEISSRISIDESNCWSVSLFRRPSFDEIKQTVEKAAKKFHFNKECEQNNQQDEPGQTRSIVLDDYSDESEKEKFSPTQRFMVCDLRARSMSDEKINQKMDIRDLQKVKAVRCKNRKRADSMYAREKQVDSA